MRQPQPRDNAPDYHEAEARAAALLDECARLAGMTEDIARARAILAYSGDRAKRALACAVIDARNAAPLGMKPASHASLECSALASTAYRDAISALQSADEDAERAVAEWQAALAKIEALRTVTALERAKAQML